MAMCHWLRGVCLQMDTQGNLFNFFNDIGGERKITPVGNISELQSFKVNQLAGVKLDRNVNVVAFSDGSEIPLPPGTGYVDENGQVRSWPCLGQKETGEE